MARFLSRAWFDDLAADGPEHEQTGTSDHAPTGGLLIQQIVLDAPDGEVQYWVRITDRQATVGQGRSDHADITFTEDYDTASAIARGALTTQAALLSGRIRVAGNLARLASAAEEVGGVDPLPAAIRAATTF